MELFDNKYQFIKDLGKGAFGTVFLAKEQVSNRLVAIKQLKSKDKEEQELIIHEIESVSKFENPNIVTYYHHFWQDELLYLVMEYCAGGSLSSKIKSSETTPADIFIWIQNLAKCLSVVHKKGIVHHDIKPDNILLNENGVIKISDFGIANKDSGTRAYMSPESFGFDSKTKNDPRVDVYALGVTLMELLIKRNPFSLLSKEQILEIHQKADFQINEIPNWQQEIILKAINKVPELRFQNMLEFEEAIKAQAVPVIFKKDTVSAALLVEHAEKSLKTKKWINALKYLELADTKYPNDVSLLQAFGKYYLRMQKIRSAKFYFEKALSLNPRLDLQKDLGWINLESKNYPIAISLLTDHLHRHSADFEAYNLLLRCYYETNRYEPAIELAKMLMESNEKLPCFANNYYISYLMLNLGKKINPNSILKSSDNPFIEYNFSLFLEEDPTHSLNKHPTFKSKLLFMDFNFNIITKNTITFLNSNNNKSSIGSFDKPIIRMGREGYEMNDLKVPIGESVSRRHCLIINSKDDVWLYDLESTTGTFLNGERVRNKVPIIGVNKLTVGDVEFTITTDNTKLL